MSFGKRCQRVLILILLHCFYGNDKYMMRCSSQLCSADSPSSNSIAFGQSSSHPQQKNLTSHYPYNQHNDNEIIVREHNKNMDAIVTNVNARDNNTIDQNIILMEVSSSQNTQNDNVSSTSISNKAENEVNIQFANRPDNLKKLQKKTTFKSQNKQHTISENTSKMSEKLFTNRSNIYIWESLSDNNIQKERLTYKYRNLRTKICAPYSDKYKASTNHYNQKNALHDDNHLSLIFDETLNVCKNDIGHFDFHLFYNTYNESVFLAKSLHTNDYNAGDSEIIDELVDNLILLPYRTKEQVINEILMTSHHKNRIRFIAISKKQVNVSDDFSGLNNNPGFDQIEQISFFIAKTAYKAFKDDLNNENWYFSAGNKYIGYITNILFCKNNAHQFYVLKPEFWKLQLFMPEIYFYMLWKIKEINIAKHINCMQYKKHLVEEAERLYILLLKFIRLCNKDKECIETIESIKSEVITFRESILSHLTTFYPNTSTSVIYTYACNTIEDKSYALSKYGVFDLLNILAFAGQTLEYSKINNDDLNKNYLQLNDKISRSKFLHKKLMGNRYLKEDTINILQMIPIFLAIAKNGQSKSSHKSSGFFPKKVTNLMIYQRDNDDNIYVLSFTTMQTLSYLCEAIYNIFKD